MQNDSVSAMADGALATVWSVASCWAGLTWAYAITTRQWPWDFSLAEWLLGWMGAVAIPALCTLGMPKVGWCMWYWVSWLLLPFVLWMFRGAMLKEWNRWIVAGVLALVAGGLGFVGMEAIDAGDLSWRWAQWTPPVVMLSLAAAAVLFGTAQERGGGVRVGRRAVARSGAVGGGTGSVGEPAEEAVAARGELRR